MIPSLITFLIIKFNHCVARSPWQARENFYHRMVTSQVGQLLDHCSTPFYLCPAGSQFTPDDEEKPLPNCRLGVYITGEQSRDYL